MAPSAKGPFALLHGGQRAVIAAHYVVTPSGSAPGPGVGWRTLCGRWWADGVRTSEEGWSFADQGAVALCRFCKDAANRGREA